MSKPETNAGETVPVFVRRKQLAELEQLANSKLPPLSPKVEEFWVEIPLSDGWISHTLVTRPKPEIIDSFLNSPRITTLETCQKRPLMIHFYGGGFALGSPLQLTHPARLFAEHFNATVICPSYRLAPEHPWPQGMKDGMDIVQQISSNQAYHYGADPGHGFILGGVSAGGSIAAVVAGLTSSAPAEYPLPRPLTGVFISISLLVTEEILPKSYKNLWTSREDNEKPDNLNTAALGEIFQNLNCTDYTSPWFSPINLAKTNSLASHPPTYIEAAVFDTLRDDSVVYEKMLAAAGVKTKISIFADDGHNALTSLNVMSGTKSKNPTIEEATLQGIGWLIEQGMPFRQSGQIVEPQS